MNEALLVSSIALAMKTLYESIKSCSLTHLTIHNLPLVSHSVQRVRESMGRSSKSGCQSDSEKMEEQKQDRIR